MSLNVKTIDVAGRQVTLRLTSKALMNFNMKHGVAGSSPTIAVLGAATDMAARIDLMGNALNHPENKNIVKDGGLLLDLMADDPSWGRDAVNQLILELAEQSGLISSEETASLLEAVKKSDTKLISTLDKLLTGEQAEAAAEPDQDIQDEEAENPI